MSGFLERLEPAEREALVAIGAPRRCPRGTPLFRQGDDPGAVYVLERGWVKISVDAPQGREVVLALRGAGELLGEMAALASVPRAATLTAATDVAALAVPGPAFRALVERRPGIALVLLSVTSERLLAADRLCLEFASFDVLGRVARRLADLAGATGRAVGGGVEIDVPLTQEDLASWTGSSREAVSRALGTLRRLGWVAVERRRITVLDGEALARYVAG